LSFLRCEINTFSRLLSEHDVAYVDHRVEVSVRLDGLREMSVVDERRLEGDPARTLDARDLFVHLVNDLMAQREAAFDLDKVDAPPRLQQQVHLYTPEANLLREQIDRYDEAERQIEGEMARRRIRA